MADLDLAWHRLSTICAALPDTSDARLPRDDLRAYRVGANAGTNKVFAFLARSESVRGIHVRSVDPAVLGDPRFEESRLLLTQGRSNWVRLRWTDEEPDWDEVGRLVTESHRLTVGKNQGIPTRGGFGDLYPILGKALAVAATSERPAPPFHADGPMPKLPAAGALAVALWCAERARPHAPAAHRPEIDATLALVREVLRAPPESARQAYEDERFRHLFTETRAASTTRPKDSRPLGAAKRAAGAAASWCRGKPDMVWEGAAHAAERVVQTLQEAKDRGAVRAFLEALDDRVLLEEMAALDRETAVERVLWRGANEKGLPALWLARFPGGTYGLRRKLGARYTWLRGARDDVLASVPDIDFERAVAMVMARDLPASG